MTLEKIITNLQKVKEDAKEGGYLCAEYREALRDVQIAFENDLINSKIVVYITFVENTDTGYSKGDLKRVYYRRTLRSVQEAVRKFVVKNAPAYAVIRTGDYEEIVGNASDEQVENLIERLESRDLYEVQIMDLEMKVSKEELDMIVSVLGEYTEVSNCCGVEIELNKCTECGEGCGIVYRFG